MADPSFQDRIARISDGNISQGLPDTDKSAKTNRSWLSSFLLGAVFSAVVLFLFVNVQAISDMAPASIKEGSAPGLLGAPIMILTLIWFTFIPIWFTKSAVGRSTKGTELRGFPTGAFLVVAVGLFAIKYGDLF